VLGRGNFDTIRRFREHRTLEFTMRAWNLLVVVTAFATAACGGQPDDAGRPATVDEVDRTAPAFLEAQGEAAEMLEAPFTAEQIHDEWIEGFTVIIVRSSAGETRRERWTVVAADGDGADIEYAAVDDDGAVLGEPVTARSTWNELRDHALFPKIAATREWTTRDTAFGRLEGWLYRVTEEEPGTITELFFAASLPGAPVQMTTYEDGGAVSNLEQVERFRKDEP
jgi:hypothetical protein